MDFGIKRFNTLTHHYSDSLVLDNPHPELWYLFSARRDRVKFILNGVCGSLQHASYFLTRGNTTTTSRSMITVGGWLKIFDMALSFASKLAASGTRSAEPKLSQIPMESRIAEFGNTPSPKLRNRTALPNAHWSRTRSHSASFSDTWT